MIQMHKTETAKLMKTVFDERSFYTQIQGEDTTYCIQVVGLNKRTALGFLQQKDSHFN